MFSTAGDPSDHPSTERERRLGATTAGTMETMMVKGRCLLAGIALVLALVATGAASPVATDGAAPLAAGGNKRAPVLATDSLGTEVAVLATKLEQFRSRLWPSRNAKGGPPVLLLGVAATAWAARVAWRRHRTLPAVPLVVVAPLSGIARRAPPLLPLAGR